jgi:hypothetical protein
MLHGTKHLRTVILVLIAILLAIGGAVSCGESSQKQYVNSKFGYSIEYPSNWIREELNPNEIGIKPQDNKYNQIQIGAWHGVTGIDRLSDAWVTNLTDASLKQFLNALGGKDINIFINERATGNWDWLAMFAFTFEDTPLQGAQMIKETDDTTYVLTILQCLDWPEGGEVIKTFKLIEVAK